MKCEMCGRPIEESDAAICTGCMDYIASTGETEHAYWLCEKCERLPEMCECIFGVELEANNNDGPPQ